MIAELTEKDKQEISSFTETGKTVTHRGREYDILNPPPSETRAESRYVIRSKRGLYYALMRNKPDPGLLFGVALYGGRLKCLQGWFTDKTGELVSLG